MAVRDELDTSFSFDPVLHGMDMERRQREADEYDEPIEPVFYETPDLSELFVHLFNRVPEGIVRFTKPLKGDDAEKLIVSRLQDNAWFVVYLEAMTGSPYDQYRLSQLPDKGAFFDKYKTLPRTSREIKMQGIFRPPVPEELAEGFELPVFMLSPVNLAAGVTPQTFWQDYLDQNARPSENFRDLDPLSFQQQLAQHRTASIMIPTIGDFMLEAKPDILPIG